VNTGRSGTFRTNRRILMIWPKPWRRRFRIEHGQDVTQMNETRRPASAGVQRAPARVTDMINEPGHPTGSLVVSVERGYPMLKIISAALLAVSVLAAPAMAGTTTPAMPGTLKTTHASTHAPAVKSAHIKASVLNAHAQMGRHHHHYRHFRHHHFHKR
jgi:hypothetical protein